MRIVETGQREAAFAGLSLDEALARCNGKKDADIKALLEDPDASKEFGKIIKSMEEDELRTMVVDEKVRPDGRKADEIRPIWSKVHYVPCAFTDRGFSRAGKRRCSPPRPWVRRAMRSAWTASLRSKTSATCTFTTSRLFR